MQSVHHAPIGYQSTTNQIPANFSLADYLAGLSNAGTYGAQFIEVLPSELKAYIGSSTSVQLAVSSTLYNLNPVMSANNTNNATTALCPAPTHGSGFSTYY
jgi:hypothetical protein